MVQPPAGAGPGEQLPPHDPWAPTERVATPAPAGPVYPPTRSYPYPGLFGGQPPADPVIMSIGEIQVTGNTVRTPIGEFPLRGSRWQITESWTTEQRIPNWAIVLTVVGFFFVFVFSLLFLLARRTVHRAVVNVLVTSGTQQYVARIPAADTARVQYLYQQVNYVRSLAAI